MLTSVYSDLLSISCSESCESASECVRAPECNCERRWHSCAGNMSLRVAAHCPSFTSAGPLFSRVKIAHFHLTYVVTREMGKRVMLMCVERRRTCLICVRRQRAQRIWDHVGGSLTRDRVRGSQTNERARRETPRAQRRASVAPTAPPPCQLLATCAAAAHRHQRKSLDLQLPGRLDYASHF